MIFWKRVFLDFFVRGEEFLRLLDFVLLLFLGGNRGTACVDERWRP